MSGWYPDPAGEASFRFWDGQTWTTATSGASAQLQPNVLAARPGATTVPESSGLGRAKQAPSRGSSGRSRWYVLAAAGVAAATATAVIVSVSGGKHDNAAPVAPSPSAAAGSAPGTLHFPARFGGYQRLLNTAAMQQDASDTWPLTTPFQFAGYGLIGGDPARSVEVGKVAYSPAAVTAHVNSTVQVFRSEDAHFNFRPAATGRYGGEMSCSTTPDGTVGSICVFADSTTFGITFVQGPPAQSLLLARQLRDAVETPPSG